MATTVVAPTPEPSSYVRSLVEPTGASGGSGSAGSGAGAGAEEPAPGAPDQPPAETTPPKETVPDAPGAKPAAARPEVEALIQEFAKEYGVDANDPDQRRHLKRLADKELWIRSLQEKNEDLKRQLGKPAEGQPGDAGAEGLTEFERNLLAEEQGTEKGDEPGAPAGPPAAALPARPGQTAVGDIGDSWQSPVDAYRAVQEAWGNEGREPDLAKLDAIDTALFFRRLTAIGLPAMKALTRTEVKRMLQEELGDVLPDVRTSVRQRRLETSRQTATSELSKVAEFKDIIPKLFEVQEGAPVVYDGREFPNSPLNQILVEHPEIMNIRMDHEDANTAETLTFLSQYRAVARIYKQRQQQASVDAGKARKLLDAGARLHEREQHDRARHGINAGAGATGLGTASSPESYVKRLNELS